MKKFSDDVELFIDTLDSGGVELVEGVATSLVRIRWLPCIRKLEAEIEALGKDIQQWRRVRGKFKAENNELGKALGYYKTGAQQTPRNCKKPEYVPKRIVLSKTIHSDMPFSVLCAEPGEYAAHCNQYGAVSIRTLGGELLGVRLDEFDVIEWQENPALLAGKETP